MKINIKPLLYLPIILLFFPAFIFYIPGMPVIPYFYLFSYCMLIILIILNWNKFINVLKAVSLKTPLKYFILFVIFAAINSLILSLNDSTNSISIVLQAIVLKMFLIYFAIFGYLLYVIVRFIGYEKFVKLFIYLFWLNLIVGFVAYIGQFFNITFINNIFDFFSNARLQIQQINMIDGVAQASNYEAYGLPRLDNLFEEPSFYARFLFVFLPFAYFISEYKYTLFKNKYLNIIVKKTIVPFTWLSLILTQSPIYFVLFLVVTIFLYYKKIWKLLKKYYLILILALVVLFYILSHLNFQNTFISRIINVIASTKSLEMLIFIEPSLGSRIVSFCNTLAIFFQHPFTGVGIANVEKYQFIQTLNSNLPITSEIERNLRLAAQNNFKMAMNTALIYHTLAAHGIFIFAIFSYFHIKIFLLLKKIDRYNFKPFIKMNICSYKWCWITTTILMFYHIVLIHWEILLLYVLIISLLYKIRQVSDNEISKENSYVQNHSY